MYEWINYDGIECVSLRSVYAFDIEDFQQQQMKNTLAQFTHAVVYKIQSVLSIASTR